MLTVSMLTFAWFIYAAVADNVAACVSDAEKRMMAQ